MTTLSSLKLYATHPHPCSYLPGEEATTLFIDPKAAINSDIYSQLSDLGFRRSGEHLYRPQCAQCEACVPVRIPVHQFRPNRGQKRCLQRNGDLKVLVSRDINTDQHFALYEQYISQRHQDGDMYPASREQYTSFLSRAWGVTDYLEFWLDEELVAVAVSDRLDQGLSAIYTFYSPLEIHDSRSLGVYAVLYQIARANQLGLDYVYLGYWIQGCRKMAYKSSYQPLEFFVEQTWQVLPL